MSDKKGKRTARGGFFSAVIIIVSIGACVVAGCRCTFRVPKGCVAVLMGEQSAAQFLRMIEAGQDELESLFLVPAARSTIRSIFGQLDSASFFNADERRSKSLACRAALSELLGKVGVTIESFTLDDFAFDEAFRTHLESQKVLEHRIASVGQQQDAEKERLNGELQRATALGKTSLANARSALERARIDAESHIKQKGREADAVRARAKREAQLISERIAALSSPGADVALKLELIRALRGKP
ncbi:hypothetical protein J7M28_03065, partial [bacterium]|nr:hypothetical protein [bacterium]